MGFRVWKDMISGSKPAPILLPFNRELAADGSALTYKGAVCKFLDFNDVDNGKFVTHGLNSGAMENFVGITAEEVSVSGNYKPPDATYPMKRVRIIPCFPSTIILGEYMIEDELGNTTTDTGATSALSTTFTLDSGGSDDEWIGGWIYMCTGADAGYLHYIVDSALDTSVTFAFAPVNAIAAADTFLTIGAATSRDFLINTAGTGFKSELDYDLHLHRLTGILNWVEAIGVPMQPLNRTKHDGVKFKNPRFYHSFVVGALNSWSGGITPT